MPYAAYALLLFTVLALVALVLILPVPVLAARRQMVRAAARTFLFLAGMSVTVVNAHRLDVDHCVVVANHSSYLDGVVLKAALPPRFGFVIKREMSRVPLANLLLRRIGAHFVDRGQGQRGARDARKLMKSRRRTRVLSRRHIQSSARFDAFSCGRICGGSPCGHTRVAGGDSRHARGTCPGWIDAATRTY
jgi:1-acyl-sn-glycerol-3-phosphate acyltransferase